MEELKHKVGHSLYRGAAHLGCNVNFKMSKNVPVIFHNLEGYDSHLIFKELSKFNAKINVIPNGLIKYMAFTINRNLAFIDSMQFMKSSLDSLVRNLMDEDFKFLSEEYSGELLKLVKKKDCILTSIWTVDFLKINCLISVSFLNL